MCHYGAVPDHCDDPDNPNIEIGGELCQECGLCCDGTLFSSVRLRDEYDQGSLLKAGARINLQVEPTPMLEQPCAALSDCRCTVYENRPRACRSFRCKILRQYQSGQIELADAIDVVQDSREVGDEVLELLRAQLGEHGPASLAGLYEQFVAQHPDDYQTEEFRRTHAELLMKHAGFAALVRARFIEIADP